MVTTSSPASTQTAGPRGGQRWTAIQPRGRAGLVVLALAIAVGIGVALGLHPPRPGAILTALADVSWPWLSLALLANAASIGFRAEAWRVLLGPPASARPPGHVDCLSAYSVGLLGNTLLPARAGDAARVVVATRRLPPGPGQWAVVAGSVLAQRCLDVVAFALLVGIVLTAGQVPTWLTAGTLGLAAAGLIGIAAAAVVSRRVRLRAPSGSLLWLTALARDGLAALHEPRVALRAGALQLAGWVAQLLVIDLTLRAFSAPVPLVASALVLVVVNGVLAFPLWPGGVGAYQAAVALALVPYGIASATGLSLGLGIQAVESIVGIGFGLVYAAREGLSLAVLRRSERALP
jgi:uncharacterized membrane protein YbhN (UPF0104 family)